MLIDYEKITKNCSLILIDLRLCLNYKPIKIEVEVEIFEDVYKGFDTTQESSILVT